MNTELLRQINDKAHKHLLESLMVGNDNLIETAPEGSGFTVRVRNPEGRLMAIINLPPTFYAEFMVTA